MGVLPNNVIHDKGDFDTKSEKCLRMASSYPTIDSDGDRLIGQDSSSGGSGILGGLRRCCGQHKRLLIFLVVLLLILIGHVLAIYFIYFKCSGVNCMGLKVVSLNTWGMPATRPLDANEFSYSNNAKITSSKSYSNNDKITFPKSYSINFR